MHFFGFGMCFKFGIFVVYFWPSTCSQLNFLRCLAYFYDLQIGYAMVCLCTPVSNAFVVRVFSYMNLSKTETEWVSQCWRQSQEIDLGPSLTLLIKRRVAKTCRPT